MREAAVAKIREKALKKIAKRVENAKASSSRKDWDLCAERILWAHHGHRYFRWSLRSGRRRGPDSPTHCPNTPEADITGTKHRKVTAGNQHGRPDPFRPPSWLHGALETQK
jgi:hypothetical protein